MRAINFNTEGTIYQMETMVACDLGAVKFFFIELCSPINRLSESMVSFEWSKSSRNRHLHWGYSSTPGLSITFKSSAPSTD